MVAVNGHAPQSNTHTRTEVEGLVTRVNGNGILLDGRATWLNYSKFGSFPGPLPVAGDRVRLTLNKAGYIRSIETIQPQSQPSANQRQISISGAQNGTPEVPSRETLIVRQSCLKAAATVCTYRPDITADDVLMLASAFEAWVNR